LVALDVFDRMTFMSTSPLVSPPAKPTSLLPSDACLCRQPSCCACSLGTLVTLDAYSIAPPWHAHHLFDVLPKQNLSHLSGLKLSPFIVSVPDRPTRPLIPSRGHATLTAAASRRRLVLPTFESCIFLQVPLAVACPLSPWPLSSERLWPSHCLISACCLHATCAALLLSTLSFPHYRTYPLRMPVNKSLGVARALGR
jgi:hypothetical protein